MSATDQYEQLAKDTPESFNQRQENYLRGYLSAVSQKSVVFADVLPQAESKADEEEESILIPEERIKAEEHPLDSYYRLVDNAKAKLRPDKEEMFRFKWNGLFYETPVNEHYMARLRIPGGQLTAYQLRQLAKISNQLTTGYIQITTRANFQFRHIAIADTPRFLQSIQGIGLHAQGSGADNIRNITTNPTAGFDPEELLDMSPYVHELGHQILSQRVFYNLPRKFNIAYDGGGLISTLEDTNDIGAKALWVENETRERSIAFRIALGGASGHLAFASDMGVLVEPDQLVEVTLAIVKAFIEHGNRSNRKKARLKHLLENMSMAEFTAETEKILGYSLKKTPFEDKNHHWPSHKHPHSHIGVYPQKQAGLNYVGIAIAVGQISAKQLDKIADLAERYGNGEIRLTAWQNLLIPAVADEDITAVTKAIKKMGLSTVQSNISSGVIACTGNAYCKYANTNTKQTGLDLIKHLEKRLTLDEPINIHITGCPNSCAQHYIGDIGLLGTKTREGEEAYHLFVGGGWGENRAFGRQLFTTLPRKELTRVVERMIEVYQRERAESESFQSFTARHKVGELQELFCE